MKTKDGNSNWFPPLRPVLWILLAIVSGYNVVELAARLEFEEPAYQPIVKVFPKHGPRPAVRQTWREISEDYTFPTAEEFGANAVPLVIAAYRSANAGPLETATWIRKHVPGLTGAELSPDELRTHALRSLSTLGQLYPAPVDRFYYNEIRTPNRIPILYSMAASGTRHFAFVTNFIGRGSIDDKEHAIRALSAMGTNAHDAVPLVIATLEKHGTNNNGTWWSSSLTLAQIGEHHPQTVPTLLDQLEHNNTAARRSASLTLVQLTNDLHRIRHEFVRLARMPITTNNDPGEFVSDHLVAMGVPPEVGVPLLMSRLRHMVKLDGHVPDHNSQTILWLSSVSIYGPNAVPAIKLIEDEVLSPLAPPPNPNLFRPPVGSRLWRIEQSLQRIDPDWKRTFPTNSPRR